MSELPLAQYGQGDGETAQPPARLCRVYMETFGCQMNVLDSQLVEGQLRAMGYAVTDEADAADVVLYNTCSVREHAENKVYSRIGEMAKRKREQPELVLGVLGCMAERDGAGLLRRYPQVDLLCGPSDLDKVPMLIDNALKTRRVGRRDLAGRVALQGDTARRSSTLAAVEDRLEMLDLSRSFSPDQVSGTAYVRITRGCNKFCSYCVVPRTRGAEVHRPPDHIVEECRRLVDAGVIEITLLGQTVNHYRYDHGAAVSVGGVMQPQVGEIMRSASGVGGDRSVGRRVTTFADLLARVHEEVPGLKRLRFVTSFPRDFGDDILEVMANHPRICRYLHLPAQSGSDRMLRLMNRGYTAGEYLDLIDRARDRLAGVEIAGDLICGFPTETDEDHAATRRLLQRARYKNCFVFKYSPRPGTSAIERLPDDVPDAVKRERNQDLLALQSEISTAVHAEYVGTTVRAFVESVSAKAAKARGIVGEAPVSLGWESPVTQLAGRTDGDLIVIFDGDPALVGSIVEVRVQRSAALSLFGELVGAGSPVSV